MLPSIARIFQPMTWVGRFPCGFPSHRIPFFILAILLTAAQGVRASEISVVVDPRVELLSIIARLAGYEEYNQSRFPEYDRQVAAHFGAFKDHAVVALARKLRRDAGIGFDACMSAAIHVRDISDLAPVEARGAPNPSLEKRWTPEIFAEFIEKARSFRQTSRFDDFMASHAKLHAQAADRLQALMRREVDLNWFEEYFGAKPGASFHVVVGMLNGGANYGPRVTRADGSEILYAILGVGEVDADGLPVFGPDTVETLAHEFSHSFVNPVIDRHRRELESAGRDLFATVRQRMEKLSYGDWKIMLDELFVRSAVVRYIQRHQGTDVAERELLDQELRGFVWIRKTCELLTEYEQHRERFNSFEAFAPRIAEYLSANGVALRSLAETPPARKGP